VSFFNKKKEAGKVRRAWILAISFLAVLVLLIGMGAGACGGNGDESGTPSPGDEEEVTPPPEEEEEVTPPPEDEEEVTPPEEEEEETPPPPDESHFTSDDGRITLALDGVERTKVWPEELTWSGFQGSEPKAGYDFIFVYVTIVQITGGHFDAGTGSTLFDDEGDEYRGYGGMQGSWSMGRIISEYHFELPEGAEGTFVYEVPEDVEPVKLRLVYEVFESWDEENNREFEAEGYVDITLN
jgi:hypothetical protein